MALIDRDNLISRFEKAIKVRPDLESGLNVAISFSLSAPVKEREPVRPEREHSGGGSTWWNVCGNCKTAINPNDKFCHECGRPLKWE